MEKDSAKLTCQNDINYPENCHHYSCGGMMAGKRYLRQECLISEISVQYDLFLLLARELLISWLEKRRIEERRNERCNLYDGTRTEV